MKSKLRSLSNKKVLVTCGPTWCPIDDTRVISNVSTGTLGHIITKKLLQKKCRVALLEGPVLEPFKSTKASIKKFFYYDDYLDLIKKESKKKYDIIIHAAAVSDFKLKFPHSKKLSSKNKTLDINLMRTKKVISLIKDISPNTFLVGFKLVSTIDPAIAKKKSRRLFDVTRCDLVLANSSKKDQYLAYVLDRNGIIDHQKNREDIAQSLINILKEKL